jgi:hypothetical protein
MNKFVLACIAGGWLFCGACAHHPQPPSTQTTDSLSRSDTAGNAFFPIAEVLESEIREVDSTPVAILRSVIAKGRKDSGFIKPAEFDALARQFLDPEFRNGRFEKDFTETSFMDNTTHDATFTYSTTNGDLPLQRVDVIATPQGTSHRVNSIYLERTRVSGDSSILEKMYWRAGRRFQVLSRITVKGHAPVEQQMIVSWESGGGGDGDNE